MMMEPPVGRLPPLRVLHGQPALDLDTPPPSPGGSSSESSSLTVPSTSRSPSPVSSSSSSYSQYTGEEIEHSICNLAQCYHILQPGQHPCLCTHGRVSSSFSHNKYSVSIGEHYSTLRRLIIGRSRLYFARECASRITQLAGYVQNLQVVAHDEHDMLRALQTGSDVEPYTKLEDLAAFCEDLRIHFNHWTSIQHRLFADKYLQTVLPELCQDLSGLQRALVYWRDCAMWWLHQIIVTGLQIFAHCGPNTTTQDMLWSIVRGIENYNGILTLIQNPYRNGKHSSHIYRRHRYSRFKSFASTYRLLSNVRPFPVIRILSLLAKERSKLSSLQILFFLVRNPKFVQLSRQPLLSFDWQTYPCVINSKSTQSSMDRSSNPTSATNAVLTLRDMKAQGLLQETSPQCAIEAQEEGFISKLLTAISSSTGLLQNQQQPQQQQAGVAAAAAATVIDRHEQGTSRKVKLIKSSPHRHNGNKHEPRKSVRWGDSLNAHIQQEFFSAYMNAMWENCSDELRNILHRPGLGLAGVALEGIISLGHVYQCSDALVVALGHLIEQACGKGVFTAGASNILQRISRQLISDVALSQCRSGICQALASSTSDKCFPTNGPSSIDQGSRTCRLFHSSLLPLFSLLSAAEQRYTIPMVLPRGLVRNGVTPSIQCPTTQTLLQALFLSTLVLESSTTWCRTKAVQFLASWSLDKFQLITQSDLKLMLDLSVRLVRSCGWLDHCEGHADLTTTSLSQLREAKIKLEDVSTRMNNLSSELLHSFSQNCSRMCQDVWQQVMPVGKTWRKKTTENLPMEHSPYVLTAVNSLVVPVAGTVCNLRVAAQTEVMSIAVTSMIEAWMRYILQEKPKYSLHGAHQLGQDLAYVQTWLMSETTGLELETRQAVLSLDVFKHFDGAIALLKQQPQRKGMHSPTRDDANSEYSSSTAPSAESHPGSLSSLSDCLPTAGLTPTTPGVGEALALGNGNDMVVESNGSEEDTLLRVPRRKEWLSLRVHGSTKWRLLPFGCLAGNLDS